MSNCVRVLLCCLCLLVLGSLGCEDAVKSDSYFKQCRKRLDLSNVSIPVPKEDPVPPVEARHEKERFDLQKKLDEKSSAIDAEMKPRLEESIGTLDSYRVRQEYRQKMEEFKTFSRDSWDSLRARHTTEMDKANALKNRYQRGLQLVAVCSARLEVEQPRVSRAECWDAAGILTIFDRCRDPFGTSYLERCLSRRTPQTLVTAQTLGNLVPECIVIVEDMVVSE